jgi:hypothetical protein
VGEVHCKDVIDAREAFAPYHFRGARFSQIHIIDVGEERKPMKLGDTNVCHGLSYMRKVADGKFLCGSGDFPVRKSAEPPRPLASVALYAAAHFKKLFPDTPYNIEHMWGGVFGVNHDEIPVAGELLKGWHVVGGCGGSGLNFTPALASQVANEILGRLKQQPLQPGEQFSPRRFFLLELREDLARALRRLPAFMEIDVGSVRVELGDKAGPDVPVKRGDEITFIVDERTLDAMNTDAAVLFGKDATSEMKKREEAKAAWIEKQVDIMRRGVMKVGAPREVPDVHVAAIERARAQQAGGG